MAATVTLEAFTTRFLTAYFDFHPTLAAGLGFHEYDGRVPHLSREAIENRGTYLQSCLDEITTIDAGRLGRVEWLDYQ